MSVCRGVSECVCVGSGIFKAAPPLMAGCLKAEEVCMLCF